MEMRKHTRAQLFSSELVLASCFFIMALVIFTMTWYSMVNSYGEEQADQQMQSVLLGVSDSLVLSPGDPSNWESSVLEDASSFGLAAAPNRISGNKAATLQSLNATQYHRVKENMGVGQYDIYISISNFTSAIYQFGRRANSSNSLVQSFSNERLALLNDSIVRVYVQVWRQKGRLV
jgi:hypothetical protein